MIYLRTAVIFEPQGMYTRYGYLALKQDTGTEDDLLVKLPYMCLNEATR